MRISSLFPAIVTAVTAAGFALTEPAPQIIDAPDGIDLARSATITAKGRSMNGHAMFLAAFDPLALAPRAYEVQAH
ncbi:MAG TPA: hypothetical protein VEC14_11220 [Reyranellaceae bacterium]|nr:hypothetical protein [Reyranellaceae bacterium]